MDKTKTGLLSAVAGLATMGAAYAATAPAPNSSEFLQVSSYADLLAPVQNATELLKADDTVRASEGVQQDDIRQAPVQEAQYYSYGPPRGYYHHHHHHHQAYRHDHHHHHTSYVGVPGVGGVYVR